VLPGLFAFPMPFSIKFGMSSHFVPIVWLGGKAGSGKDTVGNYIAGVFGGVTVAQADPMKRFAREVFGFSRDQLWGPSASRNAVDQRTVEDRLTISKKFNGDQARNEILSKIVPSQKREAASIKLDTWFEELYRTTLCNDIPVSPRLVLQTLGTECGRSIDRDMWSQYAIETARKLLCGGYTYTSRGGLKEDSNQGCFNFVAITDGRFHNECINVRTVSGVALKIERPNQDASAVETAGIKNHSSEKLDDIPRHFFNDVVVNDGTIEELAATIDGLMRYFYGV
jgi:hypothetical protein